MEERDRIDATLVTALRPLSENPLSARPGTWGSRSPAELLRADAQAIPFFGRRIELQELEDWVSDEGQGSVVLVTGAGGTGKTRLAIELSNRLSEATKWASAALKPDGGASVVAAIIASGKPTLIVVDYAESRVDADVIPLFEALAHHNGVPAIRVLLLARSYRDWWGPRGRLWRIPEARSLLSAAPDPIELGPLGRSPEDMFSWTLGHFAAGWGVPVPSTQLGPTSDSTPVLVLQSAALVAVLRAADGRSAEILTPDMRVVDELLGHEARHWSSSAASAGLEMASPGLDDVTLRRSVALLGLVGARDADEAGETLRRLPALADAPTLTIERTVRWMFGLYPVPGSDSLGALQPDLLLEYLVTSELAGSRGLDTLVGDLVEHQAAHAFDVLMRALDHYPDQAGALLGRLLVSNASATLYLAVQRARDTRRLSLTRIVSDAITSSDLSDQYWDELARSLDSGFPLEHAHIPLAVHTRLAESAVGRQDSAELVRESDYLLTTGRAAFKDQLFDVAVAALSAVTELYRLVEEIGRADFRLTFASALMYLGSSLDGLGRCNDAVTVLTEAIGIFKAAAGASNATPEGGHPLALALTYLGSSLDGLGRHEDAVTCLTRQ